MSSRVDCNPNATVFCLNGGQCFQGESLGCRCINGFSGEHCEVEPPACSLSCSNGGVCSIGNSHSTFDWPGEKPEDGIFCSCPRGFGGFYCEYKADICDDYEHVCLHGTKCFKEDESESYSCRCDGTSERCSEALETQFCIPSMDISLTGLEVSEYYGGVAVPSFCMNGGKCKAIFMNSEWHSGCECLPLFTGPHCEHIRSSSEIRVAGKSIYGSDAVQTRKVLTGFLSVMATCLTIGVVFGVRQVRRIIRRRNESVAEINLQGFREKYEEEEFIGALSPNGNMLFPAFGSGRRREERDFVQEDVLVLSDIDLTYS